MPIYYRPPADWDDDGLTALDALVHAIRHAGPEGVPLQYLQSLGDRHGYDADGTVWQLRGLETLGLVAPRTGDRWVSLEKPPAR